jgi:hypothetical protein
MKTKHNINLLIALSSIAVLFFPILGIIPFTLSIVTSCMIRRNEDTNGVQKNVRYIKWSLAVIYLILAIVAWRLLCLFKTI